MADSKGLHEARLERSLEPLPPKPADYELMKRRVLWKLDIRLVPTLGLLFLCSFLDRTNVGYAKIIGLEKELHLTNRQFEQGLAVFYATYIAVELPSNLILKKITPKTWLPVLTFAWGLVVMCLGFVRDFGSFAAVRALLGLAEGGLFPGIVLYLSSMYRRNDLALRIGLFYTGASLSGAFGGLFARGLSSIGPRGGLSGWRWIMIIEGILTLFCAIGVYFCLPRDLASASFLSQEERDFAISRVSGVIKDNKEDRFDVASEKEEEFEWSEVRRGLFGLQTWLSAIAYFGILSGVYSMSLFLPTIINVMHIAKTPDEAQLWTVIPYAVAVPVSIFVAYMSDRLQLRGTVMLLTLPIAIIGYAVIANVDSLKVKFAMTCFITTGLHSSVPCILVWNTSNSAKHYKRATAAALQIAIANCGGFVATFIYPKRQGPKFHEGHTVVLGLLVSGWFLYVFREQE